MAVVGQDPAWRSRHPHDCCLPTRCEPSPRRRSYGENARRAGGARGGASGGIGLETVTVIYDLCGSTMGAGLAMTLAALIGAAAVVAFRTRIWPTWLAWTSAILAVGSISPIAYIFVGIDLLWILIVSIWLFNRERTQPGTTP